MKLIIVLFIAVLTMATLCFSGLSSDILSTGNYESGLIYSILTVLSKLNFFGREQALFFFPAFLIIPISLMMWVITSASSFPFVLNVSRTFIYCVIIVAGMLMQSVADNIWKYSAIDAFIFMAGSAVLTFMGMYVNSKTQKENE